MTPHNSKASKLFRSPRRITITLPQHTFEELQLRCDSEGRSLSNLAAFLLEMALQARRERAGTAEGMPIVSTEGS